MDNSVIQVLNKLQNVTKDDGGVVSLDKQEVVILFSYINSLQRYNCNMKIVIDSINEIIQHLGYCSVVDNPREELIKIIK